MTNLQHCTPATQAAIRQALDSPCSHRLLIGTLRAGLATDCLDAAYDAQQAADLLKMVMDDICCPDPTDRPAPADPMAEFGLAACHQCGEAAPAGRDTCLNCCASLV